MAACAYCNATILFGGRRVGDLQYCNAHHALLGRSLAQAGDASDIDDLDRLLRRVDADVLALAEGVQPQRVALNEAHERIDFLERAVAQLHAGNRQGAHPVHGAPPLVIPP